MPGEKARKKRTAKPAPAPSPETTEAAEEAPAAGGLEMQPPPGYLPVPQAGFVPQTFQYSQVGSGKLKMMKNGEFEWEVQVSVSLYMFTFWGVLPSGKLT